MIRLCEGATESRGENACVIQPIAQKKSTENDTRAKTPNRNNQRGKLNKQTKKQKKNHQADSQRIKERWKSGTLFVKMHRAEGPDSSGSLRIVDSDPVLYCALYSNLDEGAAKVKYV